MTTTAYIIETDAGIQWVGEALSAMHALATLYTQVGYPTHVTDDGDIVCAETDPAILDALPGLEHVTTVTALRGRRAVRAMVECHDTLPGWRAVRADGTKRTVLTLAEALAAADANDQTVSVEPDVARVTESDIETVAARVSARLSAPFVELYEDNSGHLAIWCRAKVRGWVGLEQASESGFTLDAASVLADEDNFHGFEKITISPMDTGTWTQVATYAKDSGVILTESATLGVAARLYIG